MRRKAHLGTCRAPPTGGADADGEKSDCIAMILADLLSGLGKGVEKAVKHKLKHSSTVMIPRCPESCGSKQEEKEPLGGEADKTQHLFSAPAMLKPPRPECSQTQ